MKKTIKVFRNFAEQEKEDINYWKAMSGVKKIDILENIREQVLEANNGSKRFQRVLRVVKQEQS